MKIEYVCPKVGLTGLEISEDALIEALYPLLVARLEADYILEPKT